MLKVNRRHFVVLLISGVLFLAVVPFDTQFSDIGYGDSFTGTLRIPSDVDKNNNRIEDVLEEEMQQKIGEGNGSQLASVVVLLNDRSNVRSDWHRRA